MNISAQNHYDSHKKTAEEAIKLIKSGDRVVTMHACSEPSYLYKVLADHKEDYQNVEIAHLLCMGEAPYAQPGMEGHFIHNSFFLGAATRAAINEGRGDFTPCFFYEVPSLFGETLPVDVAMVTVTPPDENGMCSLGITVDYNHAAIKAAKTVIAQVNDQMPYTCGDSLVSVFDIDCFVEHSAPLIELAPGKIGEVEQSIGGLIADLIKDGDTLQLGIGSIPDAVLGFLTDRNDLGVHTEMFSDGVVNLMNAGNITNKRKTLLPGKTVSTFAMGTKKLYDFVNNNDKFHFAPVSWVNNPFVIAQNDNMISINSAVQVDFYGQVCAECIGSRQISGVGGQVDFVRGASGSKGGKSIIAFPSTAAKGKVSRIVPNLDFGAAVTTGRNDVDYIVTEYGIAHLKGRTLRDRAKMLIEIAHPDFRDELMDEYKKRFGR